MLSKSLVAMFREIGILSGLSPDMIRLRAAFREIGTCVRDNTYPIEDGCVENLDYEPHARGKNWIATVTPDRASPGGLSRKFWTHGSERWYKAPSLATGDVIEMGGDYYTGSGRKRADRRYILVIRVESNYFVGAFLSATAPAKSTVEKARAKYIAVSA